MSKLLEPSVMDGDYAFLEEDENARPETIVESDDDGATLSRVMSGSSRMYSLSNSKHRRGSMIPRSLPRPVPVPTSPSSMASTVPSNLLPSTPASPPTPAPSPTPMRRAPDWSTAAEHEDAPYREIRTLFTMMSDAQKQRLLAELLNMCNSQQLGFVHDFVSPRLKKDPFTTLPNELCLRILTFIDDPTTLARSSQVSRRWRELVSDDMAWKSLCEKHAYRKLFDETDGLSHRNKIYAGAPGQSPYGRPFNFAPLGYIDTSLPGPSVSAPDLGRTRSLDRIPPPRARRRPKAMSYKSHFKQRYQVETAWRTGGKMEPRQITPDQGVVTSLHLTDKYIVVALDNAKIHVFDTDGKHQKTLQGHVMGVWAMVPWDDILVSGGCDRDVRVWNMATGQSVHQLRGHTSTVRCLKMSDSNTAISGSRDTTLRIWDIREGRTKHILVGHQASVRCLEIHGDLVVSGSYDTTARIWSISEGKCLRILQGHFSQIYAIAFDGKRIATGSLDTSVRIWNPSDGQVLLTAMSSNSAYVGTCRKCLAVLQGHTSLVGQLQLRNDTLVTGGSDGSVRVWSLRTYQAIHRLAAHDNSVTSLQFDDARIVSGGSDGRVKVWDLKMGTLVRELSAPAEAVWRVVFEEEKAVLLASRGGKTVMEVWSFAPPGDEAADDMRAASPMSLPDPNLAGYPEGTTPRLPKGHEIDMPDAFAHELMDPTSDIGYP
ncbi:hypothetical protein B0A49_09735 [Cryomyces minteri]|uniref:F-box domain-containing protein n=1 Tax=Cryomyces minteri TaxID=331657 RepID=A0A4U0W4F2_9PEZI|nr:hypothetical protein B0A49_09735 [Cryomyces minteri]